MSRKALILIMSALIAALLPASAAFAGGRPLDATLTPEAEVAPFVGVEGASGTADLRLNSGRGEICLDLETEGFNLVLAHIHEAPEGQNGGVVVDLTSLIDGDDASGCVDVDRDLVKEIRKDPADYYVNVHQGASGAAFNESIRGQLG